MPKRSGAPLPSTIELEDKRSLNREKRKRDLLKITLENYDLLKRLNKKNSTYNVNKWEEDFRNK